MTINGAGGPRAAIGVGRVDEVGEGRGIELAPEAQLHVAHAFAGALQQALRIIELRAI
jgi:hypothetical protein